MINKQTLLILSLFSLLFAISAGPFVWSFKFNIAINLVIEALVFIIGFALSCFVLWLSEKFSRPIKHAKLSAKLSILLLLLITVPYLITFILFFPGCGDNDTTDVINMVLGFDTYNNYFRYDGWNDHHDLLYSLYYFVVLRIGLFLTDNLVVSVGAITFIQMLIFVLCVYRFIKTLYCNTGYKTVLVLSTIFLTINPLVLQFSVTLWKDTIFSGCMMVLCGELFAFCTNKNYACNKNNIAIMVISIIVIGLMRKNGFFISLITCVFLIVKTNKKAVFATLLGSLVALTILAIPVKAALNIQSAHFAETVGVPIQQIANTAKHYNNEEEYEYFDQIIDHNKMAEIYYPLTPDKVKFDPEFNDEVLDNSKFDFFKNYISLGIKHPDTYIDAWVNQSKILWALNADSLYSLPPYSFDGWDFDNSSANAVYDVLKQFYCPLNPLINVPILVLLTMFVFLVGIIRKDERKISLLPCLLMIAILLFSVPAVVFRYEMPLHLILPLTVCLLFTKKKLPNK